ncbi:ATP-binding protein [Agromyces laixinhei]|uniref:ATP-binding protein n=1 Tax=Agromyces laixinhei TaxID=2585717 RepID=UPI0012EE9494|nr:ATP-binding protein [Agromyces laixinhei]
MTDDDAMRLKPSARLQRFLGRELIADPNLAVLEFVKNAYDAGASDVRVEFELASEPSTLIIADNGIGMDESSFRANWLRPGFSSKSADYEGPDLRTRANAEASRRSSDRSPAGEKGLGRLAAGRLGEVLKIYTRPAEGDPWLRVVFDWSTFDDMNSLLEDIAIPFDYVSEAPSGSYKTGTTIEISGLSQHWSGRIPGRPSPGRSRTRLGRLKQDLAFLIRGEPGGRDFSILLDSDEYAEKDDIGIVDVDSASLDSAAYVYEFQIDDAADNDGDHKQVLISRTLHRSLDVATKSGRPVKEALPTSEIVSNSVKGVELTAGPVRGRFVYTPPPAAKRAKEVDAALSGVLLYRDDVLVEPYGLGDDDWLGVEARKASRQGHAAIQPSTFSGEVRISRSANPELVDMSNRLGLIENQASSDFLYLMRAEFSYFEGLIYEEVLREDRWAGKKEEKASAQAVFAERLANVRLRAIAHRAGQPIQAMGFDVVTLHSIAQDPELDSGIALRLKELVDAVESNLRRLGTIISELTDVMNLEFKLVSVANLLDRVMLESSANANRLNVALNASPVSDLTVFVPEALAFEALIEIVTNAIEAPRASGQGRIDIEVLVDDSSAVRILVRDDGTGIPDGYPGMVLSSIGSTKARPADGLVAAETAAVAAKGSLEVQATSESGTTMSLVLPRKVGN